MSDNNKKTFFPGPVVIVMVSYNAERTLEKTVKDIPSGRAYETILVDDDSRDDTILVARKLNLTVLRHEKNRGYGASQKTGFKEAIRRGAGVIVLLHADYQYDPGKIPELVKPILEERADTVYGSRMMDGGALKGGMPLWKYYANIVSTKLINFVFGMHLSEYHSGFRAYSRALLESIDFENNSDNYIFDMEITERILSGNHRIAEIAIPTRYFKEASSITLWPCIIYGLGTLALLFCHLLARIKKRIKPRN